MNWIEIDADAIRSNLSLFQQRLGRTALGAVVKSNAYGHGMPEVAAICRRAGVPWLCVNNVDEGVELRRAGDTGQILIMGYVPLDRLDAVVELGLKPVVYNVETIERLGQHARELGKEVSLHLKLETGTYRQGVSEHEAPLLARRIRETPGLALEGLATHFANIEDTTDHAYALSQMESFARIVERVEAEVGEVPLRHAACSAAALLFTRTHLDLARIGISLYGLWPSRETYVSCQDRGKPTLELRPALTWKTRVAQIRSVSENSFIGYGCAYRTTRSSRIAVLPVGYHEGYDRGLSGMAHVLVRGRRAPIRGRVCMNMCMADVTDVPGVALEDEVVLLGRQGAERLSAEQLAGWCGTISYEIVSRIHPALPRVLVGASPPA